MKYLLTYRDDFNYVIAERVFSSLDALLGFMIDQSLGLKDVFIEDIVPLMGGTSALVKEKYEEAAKNRRERFKKLSEYRKLYSDLADLRRAVAIQKLITPRNTAEAVAINTVLSFYQESINEKTTRIDTLKTELNIDG